MNLPYRKYHAKRFSLRTYPLQRRFDCKGSELFWIEQEKSDFFAFFDSANHRRALDKWRIVSRGSARCVTVIIRRSYGDYSVIIR